MRSAGGRIWFRGLQFTPISGVDHENAFIFERILSPALQAQCRYIQYFVSYISHRFYILQTCTDVSVPCAASGCWMSLHWPAWLSSGCKVLRWFRHSVFQTALCATPALNTQEGWQNFGEFQEGSLSLKTRAECLTLRALNK